MILHNRPSLNKSFYTAIGEIIGSGWIELDIKADIPDDLTITYFDPKITEEKL
jgi:hypothetical protein